MDSELRIIREFSRKLPKFPDGRIDYSNSDTAPVINIFLEYKGKILLLKRSDKVHAYQEKWNAVSGYLDELKPISQKAKEEIKEELQIEKSSLKSIQIGRRYKFKDSAINKTWIIYPVLAKLKEKPKITLDWEHTEYKWIEPKNLTDFDIVPDLEKSWENAKSEKI